MTPIRKKSDQVNRKWSQQPMLLGSKLFCYVVGVSLLLVLANSYVFAQAAAEYGGATSSMAGSISSINLWNKIKFPDTTQEKPSVIMSQPSKAGNMSSNYILDSMKQGSVTANRDALEQRAGKDAAKLMLRSTPTDASVKINGKLVGKTPILLVVPPGQYDVAIYGKRMEHAEQMVDLLPKETREFLLPLKQLYPTEVTIKLH
jgi:PEGA domain